MHVPGLMLQGQGPLWAGQDVWGSCAAAGQQSLPQSYPQSQPHTLPRYPAWMSQIAANAPSAPQPNGCAMSPGQSGPGDPGAHCASGAGAFGFVASPIRSYPQCEQSPDCSASDSVVPVEHASSQIWGVTLEYENLLNVQRDQHLATVRHMSAEASQLRQAVQMFQAGRYDEGFMAHSLRAKDEEMRLAVEAKQKELELFSSLLRVRDRQIGELQAQASDLQRRQLSSSRDDGAVSETLKEAFKQTEELRKEKVELERLLLVKERQMNAIQAVNPEMADSSALQLGAQAIQMFHDSMRLKTETADCAQENQELRNEVDGLQLRVE
ncbi:unnamed protein product, partial [Polarella glacialis]